MEFLCDTLERLCGQFLFAVETDDGAHLVDERRLYYIRCLLHVPPQCQRVSMLISDVDVE